MSELYHHGVKGMKWGVLRSRTAVLYDKNPGHKAESKNSSSGNAYEGEVYRKSLKGNIHRLAAANYSLNAKVYRKLGNNTLASMNENAKKNSLKKAEVADKSINAKRSKSGGSDSTKSKTNKSMKGNIHRLAAANYSLNAKVYRKLGNNALASMNENAKKNSLKKAKEADKNKRK